MSNNGPDPRVYPLAVLGSVILWVAGLLFVLCLDDPRLRWPSYVGGMGLAGLGWLGLIRAGAGLGQSGAGISAGQSRSGISVADSSARRWAFLLVVGLGVAMRLIALGLPPAFSEDVFRYIYEGRAVWYFGWTFPFAHAPAAAPSLGVPLELLDHAWLRINHPELSTIYPPLAQVAFVGAAGVGELVGGGHLWFLKAVLVAADLVTWWLLAASLKHSGQPIERSFVWGLSPLVILEVAREGHADSLSAAGLALGIFALVQARPRLGYAGWALAALAKLNGLIALPAIARTTRRGLLLGVVVSALVAIPYAFAGGTSGAGLSAYATRWRAGDGAFSLLLRVSRILLGGEWAYLSSFNITLTQHQVARGLTGLVFAAWSLAVLWRPAALRSVPARGGLLLLGLLLLSPTLHPWYVLWVLPFAAAAPAFHGRTAVLILAGLVPLLHHPGWLELIDGEWRDLGWVRATVHLPVWLALVAALATARRTR